MTHYAGIDVSLETSSICIVDAAGAIVRELKTPSEPEALAAALRATGLPFARVGLEAGPLSQWLYAGLVEVALPVVLLETRRLRAATRSMPVKTDRTDARAIAQVVRTGWFRAVHVKSELSQEARALLTARKLLVGKLRDLDNGVRGLLRGFGLKVGRTGERAFPGRARELVQGRPALEAAIEPLLQAREALLVGRERLHRLVLAAVRGDAVCRRLMTVPGVGPVTALTFCSAVDDPARFSRSRGRRALRPHAAALPVRRDRPGRAHQQARRRSGPASTLRGGERALDPDQPLVGAEGLGHGCRQARRHAPSQGGRREKAGGRAAPDLVRWQRVSLEPGGGCGVARGDPQDLASDVPSRGRGRTRPQQRRCRHPPSPPARLARPACLAVACGGTPPTTNRSEEPAM